MVLAEIFKKRDVYLSFFLSASYYIALIACVADDIYRDKHQRSIAWLFGKVAFIPAEKSQSEEEGVAAVFLHAHLCGAVEAFKGDVKGGFIKDRAYAVVFELVLSLTAFRRLFWFKYDNILRTINATIVIPPKKDKAKYIICFSLAPILLRQIP